MEPPSARRALAIRPQTIGLLRAEEEVGGEEEEEGGRRREQGGGRWSRVGDEWVVGEGEVRVQLVTRLEYVPVIQHGYEGSGRLVRHLGHMSRE